MLLPPDMMKTFSFLFVVVAAVSGAGGCAARTATAPGARADAVKLYASGASCDEIASKLSVDRDHARELVRTGIVDLNRKLYRSRNR